jgi:glycine dehydrogenase subunit 1
MRYLPKSPGDREAMLAEIGVASIDDLFTTVPAEYRLTRDLKVPRQHSESEIIDRFRGYAEINALGYASFLGAGVYKHYKPVLIDTLVQRGEFLTSYTPYQPEISQGTLQAMFEFQTMICELTGMEIANASMYEGSTGAAEAIMMAVRVTGRNAAVIARTVHPEYREVIATYAKHQEIPRTEVGYASNGRVDMAALDAAITSDTACVLIQSPNFFGTIEDVAAIAELAHSKGALLIVSIAEAISLGIVAPPKEADIVSLEAQSLGVALSYGGPYCGVIACKEKFLRQMPGRLIGETKDVNGKRGFVLTLSTREQHIRREKATSNICTNQALVALMTTIFLTVYGKEGMRELAEHNLAKAEYLRSVLESKGKILFDGAPRFHEFVLDLKQGAEIVNENLLAKKIIGGLPLEKWYPELGPGASLWCATEVTKRVDMDCVAAEIVATLEPELAGVRA